jgi:hypothetical protein
MKGLGSMLVALFRPKRGFDGLAAGAKWLWLLPLALLVVSAMLKAGVSTPLVMKEQEAFITEQMGQVTIDGESAAMSGEKERAGAEPGSPDVVVPEDQMATVSAIATTSAVVFGGIGAAVAVLFTAFFFFIAGKVAAKETRFGAFLTLASVAFVPHALRNVVQTLYMNATGIALQHEGLGALVAPADPSVAPPLSYAVLSQIDIWVIWGLVILVGGLLSALIGCDRKRAWTTFGAYVAIVALLQAVPTIVSGAFMGMGM